MRIFSPGVAFRLIHRPSFKMYGREQAQDVRIRWCVSMFLASRADCNLLVRS